MKKLSPILIIKKYRTFCSTPIENMITFSTNKFLLAHIYVSPGLNSYMLEIKVPQRELGSLFNIITLFSCRFHPC